MTGQGIRRRAVDRRVFEAADAIELRFFKERKQFLEFRFGFAGKADDEGAAHGDLGANLSPAFQSLQDLFGAGGALHQLQDPRTGMLERHVEVGKDFAVSHQGNDVIDVRIGIDVMQAHPGSELA